MSKIESAVELFDQVVDLIGAIVGSFNKDAFPTTTNNLVQGLRDLIKKNMIVIQNTRLELQLRDALIDLDDKLKDYQQDSNTLDSGLCKAFQKKDFVTARTIFKQSFGEKFTSSLTPKEKGLPSPSTVWKKSFNKLLKIVG